MTRLSTFFTRAEMKCPCCGYDTMDYETLKLADEARWYAGHPITPSSAARCPSHNKAVGGSPNSQHLQGRAIDLPVADPKKLYDYLCQKYPDRYGFGLYPTFVHLDTRSGPAARWTVK